ncbi:MAG: glycosyltransferase family 2 protein [Prevotella sp.]|nr:glycosyltransferase family 2 protein [Prevotella sp.]MBO5466297.1 glycosyltransferase family 2 protein [Prevotella sp.]
MKLTVIIVNYNVKFFVEQCLDSLERALDGIDSEVFVVDNHSSDGSIEYLKPRFPKVIFIESNHNLGFARANNMAIRQAAGQYVLLLNPDTFVGEQTIKQAIEFMDQHPKAGGAGVKMFNTDGTKALESRRGLPTPLTSFYKMCGLCSKFPESRRFGKYYMGYLSWDKPERIDIISGAFCLMRKEALDKAGHLDEDFFMYGEDIDLSYRLLKAGYDNWYLPLPILHYKGESTHKSSFRYVHVFYQAMLIFFKKHYGHMHLWVTLPIKAAIYVRSAMALVSMLTDKAKKSLGFVDTKRKFRKYVFIGTDQMLGQCRQIAYKKGLDATFHLADENIQQHGHNALLLDDKSQLVVVYDLQLFSYEKVLAIMSTKPDKQITLGTFNANNGIIITHKETLR